MKSNLFQLNWRDCFRGIIVALFSIFVNVIYNGLIYFSNIFKDGRMPTKEEFIAIGINSLYIACNVLISYLGLNFITDKNGNIL